MNIADVNQLNTTPIASRVTNNGNLLTNEPTFEEMLNQQGLKTVESNLLTSKHLFNDMDEKNIIKDFQKNSHSLVDNKNNFTITSNNLSIDQETIKKLEIIFSSLENNLDIPNVLRQIVNLLNVQSELVVKEEQINNSQLDYINLYLNHETNATMIMQNNNKNLIHELELESQFSSKDNQLETSLDLPEIKNLIKELRNIISFQFDAKAQNVSHAHEQMVWGDFLHFINEINIENLINPNVISSEMKNVISEKDIVKQQSLLNELIVKSETLLSQINSKEDISKLSPKILELLKHYSDIQKKGLLHNLNHINAPQTKEQRIWTDILQSFQRRDSLLVKQHYQINSEVTTQDITKWLEKAFEKYSLNEKQVIHPLHNGTSLSKVEQYVIHMNPNNDTKPMSQELLKHFQSVLSSSKFLTNPNGSKQLSIVIRPDHLGEMRIRLLQVNGEMTVKILVSTQVAKELLETNMSQLRHMFLPHQVSVEKQELNMQQEPIQRDGRNEQRERNREEESNQSQNGKSTSENDSDLDFAELLKNLKV